MSQRVKVPLTNLPVVVLIQASDPAVYGGEEVQTMQLMEGLRNSFIFVLVVAGEGPFSREARSKGVEVKTIKMRELATFSAIAALASFLKEKQAKIVHTLDIRSNFLGRLAARRASVPVVITSRHEMYYSAGFGLRKKIRRFFYLTLDRLTAHICDRFIVVSRAIGEELIRWKRISPEKIVVIYNGINLREIDEKISSLSRGEAAQGLGLDKSWFVVGSVGRLIPEKGCETFIRAAKAIVSSMPQVYFLLVGDGPDKQRLKKLTEDLGLADRFRFLGFQEEAYKFMSLFDVFVLPSIHEGFSLTIVEAMALGKPVVATSVGGIPEVVSDQNSGILVPPENPATLSEAILELLRDKSRASEMGKRGREIVEERFQLERMLEETARVYAALLQREA